jgi:hypothetical protein
VSIQVVADVFKAAQPGMAALLATRTASPPDGSPTS